METNTPFLIIDVESIGLHGEGFAVAGGVFINGKLQQDTDFCYSAHPDFAAGNAVDRDWVDKNIPNDLWDKEKIDSVYPAVIRAAFSTKYELLKKEFPNLVVAGECVYPVETNFLARVASEYSLSVYPLHEISTVMACAGMDPMEVYDRLPDELPKHHPLADVKQSARLLFMALEKLQEKGRCSLLSE